MAYKHTDNTVDVGDEEATQDVRRQETTIDGGGGGVAHKHILHFDPYFVRWTFISLIISFVIVSCCPLGHQPTTIFYSTAIHPPTTLYNDCTPPTTIRVVRPSHTERSYAAGLALSSLQQSVAAAAASSNVGMAMGANNNNNNNNGSAAGGAAMGGEDFRCDPCNKNLSSLTRLKRHIQNVHMRPTKEPVCNICKRVYSSLNSLRNHKSIYHRNMKPVKDDGNNATNTSAAGATTPTATPAAVAAAAAAAAAGQGNAVGPSSSSNPGSGSPSSIYFPINHRTS